MAFLRRAAQSAPGRAGSALGGFAPLFERFAAVIEGPLQPGVESGAVQRGAEMTLLVPDDSGTRTLTPLDRVSVRGRERDILAVGEPDRRGMTIAIRVGDGRGG